MNWTNRLSVVTPPAAEPVTLAEAKAWLRVSHSDDDTLIESLITAAREHIDGPDGWLGRCLVSQTLDLKLDRFPPRIHLPMAPLRSVTSITYVDDQGATQTLSSSLYQVVGVGHTMPGYILPAYSEVWPVTRDEPEAVTVRFVAGYADDGASPPDYAANVPQPIKSAIKYIVADMYENRETQFVGVGVHMTDAIKAMLRSYRTNDF